MPPKPLQDVVIEGGPEERGGKVTIETGDDGIVTLAFGDPKPKPRPKPAGGFDRNLAEDLSDGARQALASYLMEEIESDIERRQNWTDTVNKAADYLGIDLVDPVTSVAADGTITQMVSTALLKVALKSWGTACADFSPRTGRSKPSVWIPAPRRSRAVLRAANRVRHQ